MAIIKGTAQPASVATLDADHHDADVHQLHSFGYAQELARRMSGFSNFAISFVIICILVGGVTAFPQSLSAAGGASS